MSLTSEQRTARQRFGARLRAWRHELGVSQTEIALRLERSQSYVSKWEVGDATEFTPEELRAYAEALHVPLLDFLIAAGFLSAQEVVMPDASPDEARMVLALSDLTEQLYADVDVWLERHYGEAVAEGLQRSRDARKRRA